MAQRYTLGPLEAPTVVLMDGQRAVPPASGVAAVDAYGCSWAAEYPDGWDSVEFLTPVDQLAGVDGGLVAPQSIGPRTVNVTGLIVAPDRARAKAATQRLLAALPRRGKVTFAVEEDGQKQFVTGTPTGTFKAVPTGRCSVVYSFALVCTDPYKRSGILKSVTTGLPIAGLTTGLTPPLVLGTLNLTTTGATGGSVVATNYGDADARPLLTITGPAYEPIIRNLRTGEYAQLFLSVGAGSIATLDFNTGAGTFNGQPFPITLMGYGSQMWALPPGDSEIEFRQLGVNDPAARMTLTWRDCYR
jgi:hypothetical protein